MQNSSEISSGEPSSPENYMSIMAEVFGKKNDISSQSAVFDTEKLTAAILGEPYGQVEKKERKGKGLSKQKTKAQVISKASVKLKAAAKVKALGDLVDTNKVVKAASAKVPAIPAKVSHGEFLTKYVNNLLHELPNLDLTEPEPVLRRNQPLILDVDAPEPTIHPESVAAAGLPAVQTSLESYTDFMTQYKNALREEVHYEVRKNVNKVLSGEKTRGLLSDSFRQCKVKLGSSTRLTELSIPVDVSKFGQSPEIFTNELVLLRSAPSPGSASSEESAKLMYGQACLQRSLISTEEDSGTMVDGMGKLTIKLLTEDFRRLTGGVEVLGEGATNVLPEIQWNHITSLTSASRKARAVSSAKKEGFWGHICQGTLVPWPEAPAVPTVYGNLNEQQNDIVNRLANSTSTGVYYLIGPPGTGKTTTLVEAVKALVKKFPDRRILVVTPSNRAMQVDIETFISSAAQEETLPFATVGAMSEKLPDTLAYMHEDNAVPHMLQPLSEVAADETSDFATLEKTFTAALALSQARINRVLLSPLGNKTPKKVQQAVDMLEDEVLLSSAQNVKDRANSLVTEVTNAFSGLGAPALAKFLLSKAQVHFSTCISSGGQYMSRTEFGIVVQDEASQCDLPEALIPVEMFKPKLWVQIGDPKQLGAFSIMDDLKRKGYSASMLERAADGAKDGEVFMLTEQYRMHPAIRKWPSDLYYGGKLTEGPTVLTRPSPLSQLPSAVPLSGLPSAFVDIVGKESRGHAVTELVEVTLEDIKESLGKSFSNIVEAHAIADTVRFLLSHGIAPQSIAVITFYSAQVQAVKDQLKGTGVYVNTVDGSQGDEYDFVFISCVRSDFNVGFLNDSRRLNVAMTRAKHACWVFGNAESLQSSNCDFSDYLDYIRTPARNNTSPPTKLLKWTEIERSIQANQGDMVYETTNGSSAQNVRDDSRRKALEKEERIAKKEAQKEAQKEAKKAREEEKAAREEKKKAMAAKKNAGKAVVEAETEKEWGDEDEEEVDEEVVELEAKEFLAPPAVPQVPSFTDDSSSTWLTDRMEKLGYSKKMMQTCHEQLVEEQGFVQESLFAELTEAECTNDFLKEIGITAKGAQKYLLRLHRELREHFYPVVKPVVVQAIAPKKTAAAAKAAAAEIALPVRKTVTQVFVEAHAEKGKKVAKVEKVEKVVKAVGKSAKKVSTAEMAYPSRTTVEQVFAAAEAERAARLRAESAEFETEMQRATSDDAHHENVPSEGFPSREEAFGDEDELNTSGAEDAPQDASADLAQQAKRVEQSLAQAQRAAASEAAKKKTRETEKLGMSANKANDAPLW